MHPRCAIFINLAQQLFEAFLTLSRGERLQQYCEATFRSFTNYSSRKAIQIILRSNISKSFFQNWSTSLSLSSERSEQILLFLFVPSEASQLFSFFLFRAKRASSSLIPRLSEIFHAARQRRRHNICLSCIAVPEGLGVKLAERSDSKFYDKGNVSSKQLLSVFHWFMS